MKAREQGGVVDERLNVYGVQSLKIAGNFFFLSFSFSEEKLNISYFFFQTAVSHQAM